MRYYNACTYDHVNELIRDVVIDVEDGRICNIYMCPDFAPTADDFDCKGLVVIPSFMDSAVTLPGKDVFKLFGLDLSSCNTLDGYLQRISATVTKNGIRGYGLNTFVVGDNGAARIKKLMDTMMPDKPCYVYFDDMTNVIVNRCILEEAKKYIIVDKEMVVDGRLDVYQIATLKKLTNLFDFTQDELQLALLSFQNTLFEKGITSVRVLDTFGGKSTLDAVHALTVSGDWKIETVMYVPCYPFDTMEEIWDRCALYKKVECSNIHVMGITVTLDGSIDSGQAALIQPYDVDKEWYGDILWNRSKLQSIIREYMPKGWDINVNAYGDRAVSFATDALCGSKSYWGTGKKIITHAYLMNDVDIQMCKENDITVCVEPNAVPYRNTFYEGDSVMIGDRAYVQYPVGRLMYAGVSVIAGSNLPVQPEISPIDGIYKASHRGGVDDVTPYQVMLSYGLQAYMLFDIASNYGSIAIDKKATFLLIDKDIINMREDLICDCRCLATVVDGDVLWINDTDMTKWARK